MPGYPVFFLLATWYSVFALQTYSLCILVFGCFSSSQFNVLVVHSLIALDLAFLQLFAEADGGFGVVWVFGQLSRFSFVIWSFREFSDFKICFASFCSDF